MISYSMYKQAAAQRRLNKTAANPALVGAGVGVATAPIVYLLARKLGASRMAAAGIGLGVGGAAGLGAGYGTAAVNRNQAAKAKAKRLEIAYKADQETPDRPTDPQTAVNKGWDNAGDGVRALELLDYIEGRS